MSAGIPSEELYNRGILHYEKGEFEIAIELFNQAIELNASNSQYYYNLGLAFVKVSKYDKAIDNFKEALAFNPKDIDAIHNLGIAYSLKGQYNFAIQSYKKAISLKPNDFEIHNNLGISYFSMGLYNDAIESFKKAFELNDKGLQVASNLAFAYYTNEQYKLAEEKFVFAISLNDKDEELFYNLANVYLKLNKNNLAEENLKKALEINPDFEQAKEALNKLLNKEEPPEEVNEAKLFFQRALEFLNHKELDLTIEALKKVLEIKRDYPGAYELLNKTMALVNEAENFYSKGLLNYSKKNYEESLHFLRKALNIKPKCTQIQASYQKALEEYEELKKNPPKPIDPEQEQDLFTVFSKNNLREQFKEKVDSLKKAIEANPLEPENHFNLGTVYIKQKDYNYALDSLKTTLFLKPEHKDAQDALFEVVRLINAADEQSKYHYKMALIYIEKGQYNKALDELQEILDVAPNNVQVKALFSKIIVLMNQTEHVDCSNVNVDEEIAKYKEIIKNNPQDAEAHYKLGLYFMQSRDYACAKESLLNAVNINPKYEEAQNSLYDLIKIMNA